MKCTNHADIHSVGFFPILETQITSARNVLHGLFLGLKVKDFPVTPSENCGHGLNCPIQPGQTAAYTISLSFSATDVPVSVSSRLAG